MKAWASGRISPKFPECGNGSCLRGRLVYQGGLRPRRTRFATGAGAQLEPSRCRRLPPRWSGPSLPRDSAPVTAPDESPRACRGAELSSRHRFWLRQGAGPVAVPPPCTFRPRWLAKRSAARSRIRRPRGARPRRLRSDPSPPRPGSTPPDAGTSNCWANPSRGRRLRPCRRPLRAAWQRRPGAAGAPRRLCPSVRRRGGARCDEARRAPAMSRGRGV
jgi:hypothetical protein